MCARQLVDRSVGSITGDENRQKGSEARRILQYHIFNLLLQTYLAGNDSDLPRMTRYDS